MIDRILSKWAALFALIAAMCMGAGAGAQCFTTSVIPSLIPTAGGTSVEFTLSQSPAFPIQRVLWNGQPAQFQQVASNRFLAVSRPGQGVPTVVVEYGFSSCEVISMLRHSPPFISSFSPARVQAGDVVTIDGSNFGLQPAVLVDGMPVQTNIVTPHSRLSFVVPAGETGQYAMRVVVAGQQSNTVTLDLVNPPVLASWIATRRATGGGDIIVATGSDFGSSPALAFGGVNAQIIRSSDTEIIAIIPAGDGASNDLFVWNGGLQGNILNFEYFPPLVSVLSPRRVNAGEPGQLVIHGRNLWGLGAFPQVFVGDVAAPVIEVREDRITVLVPGLPPGAAQVSVTLAGQTSQSTPDSSLEVVVGCPADTNGDGVVNFTDLNAVLSAFGQACQALLR